jgi:hypothetical protein
VTQVIARKKSQEKSAFSMKKLPQGSIPKPLAQYIFNINHLTAMNMAKNGTGKVFLKIQLQTVGVQQ